MNVKKTISKLLICAYALFKGFRKQHGIEKDTFVLLFFGRIGDAVMFIDALKGYKELYIRQKKQSIVLACRSEVWALLKSIGETDGLRFVELTRETLSGSFSYFSGRVKAIDAENASVILNVRENNGIENIFMHALRGSSKIVHRVYPIERKSFWNRYFSEHTYTQDFRARKETDHLTAQAELLRKLGLTEFKSTIPVLPAVEGDPEMEPGSYVCVCPGASVANKCWPSDRYAEVINCIHRNTKLAVVMCGGKSEQDISRMIVEGVSDKDRVFDYTGKSGMNEWIQWIRNAALVVGNESASIHIAAGTGTPSVCIGEQKFSDKWLPYRPEIVRPEDRIPVVVRGPRLDCDFCAQRSFKRSEACRECIEKNGIIKCVFDVRTEEVIKAVGKELSFPDTSVR